MDNEWYLLFKTQSEHVIISQLHRKGVSDLENLWLVHLLYFLVLLPLTPKAPPFLESAIFGIDINEWVDL